MNRLSEELRPEYYSLIDRCTRAFERPHTWLLSCPATRNPLAGNLLKHLVIIYLLEKMAEKGTLPSEILVDSAPLAEVLRSKLSSLDVDIPIHNLSRKSLFRIIKTFFKRVVSPLLWHLRLHYHFYRTRPASRKPKNNDIILVHTFVSPNTIDLHNTFGQAIAWLSKADQKRIWRVPSFFGLPRNQLSRFCEQLRAAPGNWMIKEDYLRLSDFFMAWTALLRSQRLDVPTVVYKDTDVSSL
ncbi:hypothetical protein KJ865_10150, partial [Myxococcota bacterium]|nr:hypothetical protein [Myxococcota bacterium]